MLFRFNGSGRKATRCIFCGCPKLTREHMFPRWTREFFKHLPPLRAHASFGRVYPDRIEETEWRLPGPLHHWEVKNVCGGTENHCNSGWMRGIENRTKPILLPLIMGEANPRLSPADLETIATWAVLKTMVADRAEGSSWAVHYKQLEYMRRHRKAPKKNWAVWIGRFQRNIWQGEWISRPFRLLPRGNLRWVVDDRRLGKPTSHFNSNSVTQVIGEVLISVVHSPDPLLYRDWRFSISEDTPLSAPFFKIWPPSKTSIVWPSRALRDQDADAVAVALSAFLNKRRP